MANTIRIKRRTSGSTGAPTSLANAELAFNEVDQKLYYGKGDDGNGTATSVIAIGGVGWDATPDLSGYAALAASNNFSSGYTNTFAGTTNFTGAIQIDGSAVNTSAAELNVLDNAASNTVVNSKAVIYGSAGEVAASSISTTGNVTVGGNLVVNGTTTTVNSTVTTLVDPIITIGGASGGGAPSSDDNKDRGVAFQWHSGAAAKVGFFGYDDSVSEFVFVPDATISSEVVSGTAGDIGVGKVNNVTITRPASAATLTVGSGKTVSINNTLTFTGTDSSSVAFGTGGTVAYTGNTLAVFAATTSSQLAGVISDETGTGALVFADTPTLVTPVLGTPTSGTLTNCTGLPVGTGISGLGTGVATFLATPSSANLAAALTDETGSSSVVFSNSPTLVTPTLGAASATSINKVAITAPATGATLTIAEGKTLTANNTLTFTGTDSSSVAFGTGGTVVYTSNKLSVFAATSSSELAGVISDETGTGALVFADTPTLVTPVLGTPTSGTLTNCTGLPVGTGISGLGTNVAAFLATPSSANLAAALTDETGSSSVVFSNSPTLVTPNIGVASATSVNKVAITAPATSATLTIADGKTLTCNNTLTFTGTDSSSVAFGTGGTVVYTSTVCTAIANCTVDGGTF